MQLPAAIDGYFTSDKGSDADALVASFEPDAVVRDEGAEHVGRAEILAWRLDAKAKYPGVVSVPMQQVVNGDRIVVSCQVSGNFPNSPVMLDFAFTLANDRISLLEIH